MALFGGGTRFEREERLRRQAEMLRDWYMGGVEPALGAPGAFARFGPSGPTAIATAAGMPAAPAAVEARGHPEHRRSTSRHSGFGVQGGRQSGLFGARSGGGLRRRLDALAPSVPPATVAPRQFPAVPQPGWPTQPVPAAPLARSRDDSLAFMHPLPWRMPVAPLVQSRDDSLAFMQRLPGTVPGRPIPRPADRHAAARGERSSPEQLRATLEGFGFDIDNAGEAPAARYQGVYGSLVYKPREVPKNPTAGAGVRGLVDPLGLLHPLTGTGFGNDGPGVRPGFEASNPAAAPSGNWINQEAIRRSLERGLAQRDLGLELPGLDLGGRASSRPDLDTGGADPRAMGVGYGRPGGGASGPATFPEVPNLGPLGRRGADDVVGDFPGFEDDPATGRLEHDPSNPAFGPSGAARLFAPTEGFAHGPEAERQIARAQVGFGDAPAPTGVRLPGGLQGDLYQASNQGFDAVGLPPRLSAATLGNRHGFEGGRLAAPARSAHLQIPMGSNSHPGYAWKAAVHSDGDSPPRNPSPISLDPNSKRTRGYLDFPTRYLLRRGKPIDREMALHYTQALGIDPNAPIFIGGAGEDYLQDPGPVKRYVGERRRGNFFRHYEKDRVDSAIEVAFALNRPIVIVGHSWGADRALEAAFRAIRRGIPVDLLVTADPVTGAENHKPEDYQRLARELAGRWANIRATEHLFSREAGGIRSSDLWAKVGGRMRLEDQERAHIPRSIRVRHGDFRLMMREGQVEQMIRSIQDHFRAKGKRSP